MSRSPARGTRGSAAARAGRPVAPAPASAAASAAASREHDPIMTTARARERARRTHEIVRSSRGGSSGPASPAPQSTIRTALFRPRAGDPAARTWKKRTANTTKQTSEHPHTAFVSPSAPPLLRPYPAPCTTTRLCRMDGAGGRRPRSYGHTLAQLWSHVLISMSWQQE